MALKNIYRFQYCSPSYPAVFSCKLIPCVILIFLLSGTTKAQDDISKSLPVKPIVSTIGTDSIDYNSVNSVPLRIDTIQVDTLTKYDKIKDLKNKLLDQLTTKQPENDEQIVESINAGYNDYQGMTIRNIEFKQLEIFGQSVKDTSTVPTKWVERLGNGLHINTQQFVLRNRLLFHPGDKLDAYQLLENERLFRELSFIDDAKVFVLEAQGDSVDILFVTKDVLPLGGGIELFDVLYGKASIYDKSLMGLGHELYYHLTWNNDTIPLYGHKLRYSIPTIGNTFFSVAASYENQWDLEAFKFYLNRNFFASNIKYAGGVGYENIYSLRDVQFPDTTFKGAEVDYKYYDLWLGRAINLSLFSSLRRKTTLTVTSRINRYEFYKRPEVNESLLYQFQERTVYLASVGISIQEYKRSKLIYGFGRTEDVPYGMSFSFTAGKEYNEFHNRPYLGLSFSGASSITKHGRIYNRASYGTFFNNGIEQGLLDIMVGYFSGLINKEGRYNYRIFTDVQYKAGFNRYEDEFMQFTRNDGIRGLMSTELRGNQRLNLKFETVCYSPHSIFGFRFLYFTFFDAGIISNQTQPLIDNQLYTGFGAGVKIRNENLIINTIQFRLAYYPILPANVIPDYIQLTTVGNQRFEDFFLQKPEIIQYQIR